MKKNYVIPIVETLEMAMQWALCALDGSGGSGKSDPGIVPAPGKRSGLF